MQFQVEHLIFVKGAEPRIDGYGEKAGINMANPDSPAAKVLSVTYDDELRTVAIVHLPTGCVYPVALENCSTVKLRPRGASAERNTEPQVEASEPEPAPMAFLPEPTPPEPVVFPAGPEGSSRVTRVRGKDDGTDD